MIAAGEDGGQFLHGDRFAGLQSHDTVVTGTARFVDEPTVGGQQLAVTPDRGAGRHRDRYPGLHRLAHQ